MSNEEHVNQINEGVKSWNEWCRGNPDIIPDLTKADLSGADLNKADPGDANLRRAI